MGDSEADIRRKAKKAMEDAEADLKERISKAIRTKKQEERETEFSGAIDKCTTDLMVKGTGGLVIGTLASVLIVRRRVFPIILGLGFGVGMATEACITKMNAVPARARR